MILKSVIQEIVSKLIPDLVVILVVISLNASAFMKFSVFQNLISAYKNFQIFENTELNGFDICPSCLNGVKSGCRVLFESYFELEMNGFGQV